MQTFSTYSPKMAVHIATLSILSCYICYACVLGRSNPWGVDGRHSEVYGESLPTHLVWALWSQRPPSSGQEVIPHPGNYHTVLLLCYVGEKFDWMLISKINTCHNKSFTFHIFLAGWVTMQRTSPSCLFSFSQKVRLSFLQQWQWHVVTMNFSFMNSLFFFRDLH